MRSTVKIIKNPVSEQQHQLNVIAWSEVMRAEFPELRLMFHVANERICDPRQGANLRRLGVRRGVPDLCLPVPRGRYHGLFIELKTEKGHTSDEQEWWGENLSAQGYLWRVCHGWEAAVTVIQQYLSYGGSV